MRLLRTYQVEANGDLVVGGALPAGSVGAESHARFGEAARLAMAMMRWLSARPWPTSASWSRATLPSKTPPERRRAAATAS